MYPQQAFLADSAPAKQHIQLGKGSCIVQRSVTRGCYGRLGGEGVEKERQREHYAA